MCPRPYRPPTVLGGAALAAALSALPLPAAANPADLFGIGAAVMARGGGGIALTDDAFSAWLNPAGLGNIPIGKVDLGFHLGWERFGALPDIASDQNHDGYVNPDNPYDLWVPEDYPAPSGLHLGAARGLTRYLRGGFSLTLPLDHIVLIRQEDPQYPYYLRWKNRPQRLTLNLAACARLADGLYIGGGISILARAALKIGFTIDADISPVVGDDGKTSGLSIDFEANPNDIEVDVRPALAPVAGVQWDLGTLAPPLRGIRLGAVYRGAIDLAIEPTELDLDLYFRTHDVGDLGEITLPLQADVLFQIIDFYTPQQVGLGAAWQRPRFSVYFDATWNQWSKAVPSVASIDEDGTTIHIGVVDLDPQAHNARDIDLLGWRDTWVVRAGGELRPPPFRVAGPLREIGLVLRAGYAYDPTWVPEQSGLTNFLDADVHLFSGGVGVWTRDPFGILTGPASLDLAFQVHHMPPRANVKDASVTADGIPEGYPIGGSITASGRVIALAASLGLSL